MVPSRKLTGPSRGVQRPTRLYFLPVQRPVIRLALAALVLAVALGGARAQTPSRPPFRWGGDAEGGAPFVEADPADPTRVRGFDVEVADMIARGLGREPRFVQVAWSSIPASVQRGDFTIGMSGVEDRAELRQRYAVTIPYFEFREV